VQGDFILLIFVKLFFKTPRGTFVASLVTEHAVVLKNLSE
jgi:hypothetical protein